MKIDFYKEKRDDISINMFAELKDGKFDLWGEDYGPLVQELRGIDDEYEYHLSLDEENTAKLFEKLGISGRSDKQKLEFIKEKFSYNKGSGAFSNFCEENGIKTDYFGWP